MSVESGLQAQIKNIEAQYGKPIAAWIELVRASSLQKHTEVVAMLKREHKLAHGAAHRIGLLARAESAAAASAASGKNKPAAKVAAAKNAAGEALEKTADAVALYAGKKAPLFPIHQALMAAVNRFGSDLEVAPKSGYLSLRRKKQFAMLKPAAKHVDVGLILPGVKETKRLESAATFNALFTHRVRVYSLEELDAQLLAWLRKAYDLAG